MTEALNHSKEEAAISYVKYIDHHKEAVPSWNSIHTAVHKVRAYESEVEIRAIHVVKSDKYWRHNWNRKKIKSGVYIKVDPKILIEEVMIGPTAPDWSLNMIKDVCKKYRLDVIVKKSDL